MTARAAAVEVIAIGTELLLGETQDGNGAWLGRTFAAAGVEVVRRAVVGDRPDDIRMAVADGLRRTGVVLCTGGLGPTRDDLTKPVIAELFGRPLVLDDVWFETVRTRFRERGVDMPASNRTQAEVPEGATVFPNARGTAPGLALHDPALGLVIMLPGVPWEMRGLVEAHVLPFLAQHFPEQPHPIVSRVVRTTGMSESGLAERIDDIVDDVAPLSVAFLPAEHGVDVRLTSWGALDPTRAAAALDGACDRIAGRLGSAVYGRGDADMATAVGAALRERRLTLAVAESCTGGLLSKRLTDAPGASDFLIAAFVPYADEAKRRFLGVRSETLARHGAVSEETARELVEGARIAASADCAIAVTGIAGPGGGSAEKPVGTVWVAAAAPDRVEVRRLRLGGDRAEIRERSAQAALALLRRMLMESA